MRIAAASARRCRTEQQNHGAGRAEAEVQSNEPVAWGKRRRQHGYGGAADLGRFAGSGVVEARRHQLLQLGIGIQQGVDQCRILRRGQVAM